MFTCLVSRGKRDGVESRMSRVSQNVPEIAAVDGNNLLECREISNLSLPPPTRDIKGGSPMIKCLRKESYIGRKKP